MGGGGIYCADTIRTRGDAIRLKHSMELADAAYDIPNPPKRTIVWREVGKWQKAKGGAE